MQSPEMPILPLRELKLPPEPGYWPLAPGWWVLIGLLVLLLVWMGIKWLRYQRKKSRWQEINHQLSEIEYGYTQHQNKQQLLTEVSAFLRRFVRFQIKQQQATTLAGDNWVDYLNQLQGAAAFEPYATSLTQGVFQAKHEFDAEGLLATTRNFIKQHVMKPIKNQPNVELESGHV
jgi:hypothetical protein